METTGMVTSTATAGAAIFSHPAPKPCVGGGGGGGGEGCVCCWVEDGYIRGRVRFFFEREYQPLVVILIYAIGGGFHVALDLVDLLEYY